MRVGVHYLRGRAGRGGGSRDVCRWGCVRGQEESVDQEGGFAADGDV